MEPKMQSKEPCKKTVEAPDWVASMREFYAKTGAYRPEDLRRVLGHPNQSVQAGATSGLAQYLSRS